MIELLNSGLYPVKDPKSNVGQDAGIDFFVPAYSEEFLAALGAKNPDFPLTILTEDRLDKDGNPYTENFFYLPPQTGINIPSGVYTKIPEDVALTGFNKSGVATSKNLLVGACVDDHSYQGILHLHVINVGSKPQKIVLDEKIVQFVPLKIDISGVTVKKGITKEEFFEGKVTERGAGGFGSTGLK